MMRAALEGGKFPYYTLEAEHQHGVRGETACSITLFACYCSKGHPRLHKLPLKLFSLSAVLTDSIWLNQNITGELHPFTLCCQL
eukprot:4351490-Pleurochrysis_carterae.AAC.1